MAKILVLDDVADAVTVLQRILARTEHDVVGFTEEEDAIDHVRHNAVDLAILDIKLKKMDGIAVLEEMRRLAPDLAVIMLTGYPTLETAREAVGLGASEYCVKPIDAAEIRQKVTDVLAARNR